MSFGRMRIFILQEVFVCPLAYRDRCAANPSRFDRDATSCRGQTGTDENSENEKLPFFGGLSVRNRRRWWRRRESNPRPETSRERPLHAQPLLNSRPAVSRRGKTTAGHPRMEFGVSSGGPRLLHPLLATPLGARRVRSPMDVATLFRQPERECCCSQLLFFTLLTREVRPRHATFRVLVPVEAVSPPRALAERAQRSRVNVNTRAGGIFLRRTASP